MGNLEALVASAGRWIGTSRLQDPHAGIADESPTSATVTPILGDRFVRLDYTWAYRGSPQEGSMLIGYDRGAHEATIHWIDSWHMGRVVMACQGPVGDEGTVSVRGSYAAPPGPDWGWRIDVVPGPASLRIVMYNISPEGHEDLAAEAEYERA